jgi:hypothetical protein
LKMLSMKRGKLLKKCLKYTLSPRCSPHNVKFNPISRSTAPLRRRWHSRCQSLIGWKFRNSISDWANNINLCI